MKSLLLLLLTSFLYGGCSSTKPNSPPPVVAIKKTVEIDPSLLIPCLPLRRLEDSTDNKVVEAAQEWLTAYQFCRNYHSALIHIVKDAFNIASPK